jgi:rod shape-determining protein MreD
MLHALRQILALLACGAVLQAGVYQLNHYIAPWALGFSVPGLLVAYAALRLPFGPGFASAFLLGLWLDAASPLPFGRHAFLLALAFCLVHRLRGRFPRTETIVGVVVALFVNLGLFVAIAFLDLGALPDPAAGALRIFGDLLCSQLLTALVGPWFLALQDAALRLVGASPAQTVVTSRFA